MDNHENDYGNEGMDRIEGNLKPTSEPEHEGPINYPSIQMIQWAGAHFHELEAGLAKDMDELKSLPKTTCCNMPKESFVDRINRIANALEGIAGYLRYGEENQREEEEPDNDDDSWDYMEDGDYKYIISMGLTRQKEEEILEKISSIGTDLSDCIENYFHRRTSGDLVDIEEDENSKGEVKDRHE